MLSSAQLVKSLESIEPPPCQGCENAHRCGAELLACSLFAEYVDEPGVGDVVPTRGAYDLIFSSVDVDYGEKGKRKNPVNKSQMKRRTCSVCGVTHLGVYENFGYKNGRVCNTCRAGGYDPMAARRQSKVCVSCGEEKVGLKNNFRQTSVKGTNGRVKVYRDVCKKCEDRYVSRLIS